MTQPPLQTETPKPNGRLRRLLPKLIGPVIFAVILYRIDLRGVLDCLARTHLVLYLVSCLIPFVMVLLKALRWRIFVNANLRPGVSVSQSYAYSLAGLFLGAATPGRVGELYKIAYVRKKGLSIGSAATTVLVDRGIDVLMLIVLAGLLGADYLWVFSRGSWPRWLLYGGPILFSLICLAAFLFRGRLRDVTAALVTRVLGDRLGTKAAAGMTTFLDALKNVSFPGWGMALFLTFLGWLTYCLQKLMTGWAIGMTVNPLYLSAVCLFAAVLSMLPVSVLGLGTRDAVYVYLLGYAGVSSEQAIALSSLVLFSMILTSAAGCLTFMILGRTPDRSADSSCDATSS